MTRPSPIRAFTILLREIAASRHLRGRLSASWTIVQGSGPQTRRWRGESADVGGLQSLSGNGTHASTTERILLVACPGGHLQQMLALKPAWEDLEHRWVTLEAADTSSSSSPRNGSSPTGRPRATCRTSSGTCASPGRSSGGYKPDVILSTGAALAVPFFVVGRLLGVRLVYVESFTRVQRPALTGRLVYPLTDAFFVQWPTSSRRRRAIYAGSVV